MAYYRNPLEEERQRQRAAMMRGTMSPGMTSGMLPNEFDQQAQAIAEARMSPASGEALAAPTPDAGSAMQVPYGLTQDQYNALGQDFTGRERSLKRQADYADSLRRTKTPGVRQVGNVAATNIWEGLETGFNRALGGYLAGEVEDEQAALDKERGLQAAAVQAKDDFLYEQGREDRAEEMAIDAERDTRDAEAREAEAEARRIQAKENADALAAYREDSLAVEREKLEAQTEQERIKAEAKAAETADKMQKEINKQTRNYTRELLDENIPRLETNLNNFRSLLEPYRNEDGSYSNIPGVGGLMNARLGGTGTVLAQGADVLALSDGDARRIQQAWQEILNTKIKDDSGATVTVQENERLSAALGKGIFDSDASMLNGLDLLEDVVGEKRAVIDAGYPEEVLQQYRTNRGEIDEDDEFDRLYGGV